MDYTEIMPAQELKEIAKELRIDVLQMVYHAGGGHIAGPMSAADLLAVLYFGGVAKFNPDEPWSEVRDRIILSCGHYAPILYASLSRAGFFPKERLMSLGKRDGLPVHPECLADRTGLAGVEASTGPLGQGMSVAVGIAKALKVKRNEVSRVFCICSDGELQEGQAWEAIGLAVREKLDNLVWLIDANNIQIGHYVTELAGSHGVVGKLEAFGCHTLVVDGHDVIKIQEVLQRVRSGVSVPTAVVLRTIGGKGVSFLENNPKWHDGRLTDEQYEMAKKELLG